MTESRDSRLKKQINKSGLRQLTGPMKTFGIVIAAFGLFLPVQLYAHPHVFAEARLEVVAGEDGMISELHNIWRFDEVFSSTVLMEFDKNADLVLDADELARIGDTVQISLAENDYFMAVTLDGKDIDIGKPDTITVDYKDGQLLMFFALKPVVAMPIKGKMTFGVYDPTMYTAIDFPTDQDLVLVGDGFKACKQQVVRPDADEVLAQNQASLTDAFFSDPAGTDMTKLFATRLEINC